MADESDIFVSEQQQAGTSNAAPVPDGEHRKSSAENDAASPTNGSSGKTTASDKKSKKASKKVKKQEAPPSAGPVNSSSSTSSNNDSNGGGSSNSAEVGEAAAGVHDSASSRMRWHNQRGSILGQFHVMNPVQRIDLIHDILLNLYPAERMWIEKVMEDVRQTDAQYFMDFSGHSNDKNANILKDYLKFGDARAVLIHEGMRKSLIMDVAFLKATSFYNADAFHKLLMDASLDSVCFMPDQLETLMQLMLLYRFCSRHPAFRIQQRFDFERVFHTLEHQYYTYCDGGSFLQAAGISENPVSQPHRTVSAASVPQQQQYSTPSGADSSSSALTLDAAAAGTVALAVTSTTADPAEAAKFQQALNRHLEYMYNLDTTSFPPHGNSIPQVGNYAAPGIAGDVSGYNAGSRTYLAPPSSAAAANGGMPLQRLKSASLNDVTTQLEFPALDPQQFSMASHSQASQRVPFSAQNFLSTHLPINTPSAVQSKESVALVDSFSSVSKPHQQPASVLQVLHGRPTVDGAGGQGFASVDADNSNQAKLPSGQNNRDNSSRSIAADVSLPKTALVTTANILTSTSTSSTVTVPFAKLNPVPNAAYLTQQQQQQQQQHALHLLQQGVRQPTAMMFSNAVHPDAALAAEVTRMLHRLPANYAVDPILHHYNKSGVSLESGTQLGLNDDEEHTQFFVGSNNNNNNAPNQQQYQQQQLHYHNFPQHARFMHHQLQQQQHFQQHNQQVFRSASGLRQIQSSTRKNQQQQQQQHQQFHPQMMFSPRLDSNAMMLLNSTGGGDNYDHTQQQLDNAVGPGLQVNDSGASYGIFYAAENPGEFANVADAMNIHNHHQQQHHFCVNSSDVHKTNAPHLLNAFVNPDDASGSNVNQYSQQSHAMHPYTKQQFPQNNNENILNRSSTYQQHHQPDIGLLPQQQQQHQNMMTSAHVPVHPSPHHFYAASAMNDEPQQQQQQQQLMTADPYGNYSPNAAFAQQPVSPTTAHVLAMSSSTATTTSSTAPLSRATTSSKVSGSNNTSRQQQQQHTTNISQPVVTINPEALQFNAPQQQQPHRFQAPHSQHPTAGGSQQNYTSGNNSYNQTAGGSYNSFAFNPQQQAQTPSAINLSSVRYQQQHHNSGPAAGSVRRSQQQQQQQQQNSHSKTHQRSNVTSPVNTATSQQPVIKLSAEGLAELQKHFVLQYGTNSPQQQGTFGQPSHQNQYRLTAPALDAHYNNKEVHNSPELVAGMQQQNLYNNSNAVDTTTRDYDAAATKNNGFSLQQQQLIRGPPGAAVLQRHVHSPNLPHSSSSGRLAATINSPPPGYASSTSAGLLFQHQQQQLPRFQPPQPTLQEQHAHENLFPIAVVASNVASAVSRNDSARSSPAKSAASSSSASVHGATGPIASVTERTSLPAVAVEAARRSTTQFTPSSPNQPAHRASHAAAVAHSTPINNNSTAMSANSSAALAAPVVEQQRVRNASKNSSGSSSNVTNTHTSTNWRAIPQEQQPLTLQQHREDHAWGNINNISTQQLSTATSHSLNYAGVIASGSGTKQQQSAASQQQQKKSCSRNSAMTPGDSSPAQQSSAALSSSTSTHSITSPPLQQTLTLAEQPQSLLIASDGASGEQRQQGSTMYSGCASSDALQTLNQPNLPAAINHRQPAAAGVVNIADYSACNGVLKSTSPPVVVNAVVTPSTQKQKSDSPSSISSNVAVFATPHGATGQNRMPLSYAAASAVLPSTLTSSKSSSVLQTSSTAASHDSSSSARPIARNR